MDANIEFGPLIDGLINSLFEKDAIRLSAIQVSLIERNYALGMPQSGFLFGGKFHTTLSPKQRVAAEKRVLHPQLHEECKAYLDDERVVEQEKLRLTHGVHLLLRGCHTLQDLRDVLPDAATPLIPEIAGLKRYRDPGYTVAGRPLLAGDLARTVELVGFYATNRMLY